MSEVIQTISYIIADNALIIENLLISALCGIGIFFVFYVTYRKVSVSRSFTYTLIMLPPISCMIAIGISNDLVLAAGMLGALSIIRFRHSVKETKNLVFVFWAVTAGITCGLSIRRIVLIWCFIVALLALAIHFLFERRRFGTVAVRTSGGTEEIESIFDEFSIAYDVKHKSMNETSDILYECKYKKGNDKIIVKNVCERIMRLEGVYSVRFIEMR